MNRYFSRGVIFCIWAIVQTNLPLLQAELVDGIAAVVNDDIITFSDIKNMVGPAEETIRKSFMPGDPKISEKIKEVRKDALNQLIERQLIIQQFKERGGKIPDQYIDEDINFTIEEQYGRDRSIFIKSLEALGLNFETYRERIRDKLIVRIMQQHEVGNDIIISPFKIEQYYQEHIKDFEEVEKVKLRMIYIKKTEDTPQEVESLRNLSQEILVKLSTGSDFSSLASI
jgi:parvulin-like peptidyl-prolyl isomerase